MSHTVTSRETVRTVSDGISIRFRNTSNKDTEQRRHRRCSDLLQKASLLGATFWGSLFFLFMFFAALSTVIAVFENITAFAMDLRGWSRKKSALINGAAMLVLSAPCILGFNLLSGFMPLGQGTNIMDLEDFLVSNNLLPLGSLAYLLFCTSRAGWGWKNFLEEVNLGSGAKFPRKLRYYMTYMLPVLITVIYLKGYWDFFAQKDPAHLALWMVFAVLLLLLAVWFAFGHLKKQAGRKSQMLRPPEIPAAFFRKRLLYQIKNTLQNHG